MRKLFGWLCYASLVLTIYFAAYYCYIVMAPFFRGAEVRQYWDRGNPGELAEQIAVGGVTKSDESLLRGFVNGGRDGHSSWRSWDAWGQLVDTWTTPKVREVSGRGVRSTWAAAADESGKVVASYPEHLARRMGHVNTHTDSGWRGAVNRYEPVPADLRVAKVMDSKWHNRAVGSVAVAVAGSRPGGAMAIVPPGSEIDGWLSPFSALLATGICLLAFLILLPTWVAMDAEWRGMRGFAWVVLLILTGPIGLAAYFIARPKPPKPCPNCGEEILSSYKRCPACGVFLLATCPVCRAPVKPGWHMCPRCGAVPGQAPERPPRPEPEPARVAPATTAVVPSQAERESGVLSVLAVDADGLPVKDATVTIDGPSALEGLTDSEGSFEARKLEEGPYVAMASRQGYDVATSQVEVRRGEIVSARLVLTARSGVVAGRVLDRATTLPVSGAKVYIDSARLDRSCTTDVDGAFTLEDIPPGPYAVCVEAEGHLPQTRLADVGPGQYVTLDFALELADAPATKETANAAE